MKRTTLILLVLITTLSVMALTGCGASPKARADEVAKYLPGNIGGWSRDDGETVKLLSSTVTSKGHVTMLYDGADEAIAYIVIEAQPSEDAAEVAMVTRERELRLQGLELDTNRQPQMATATVAQTDRVRYALFQEGQITVEIDTIAGSEETPVSDEAFDELLMIVRAALNRVED
jgi:hypothetical protein